jgi:hypothetical protein
VKLFSVPTTRAYLDVSEDRWNWTKFLPGVAKRSRDTVEVLLAEVLRGQTQIHLILNDADEAVAMVGTQLTHSSQGMVGNLVWMTGEGRHDWEGLLPALERYLKEHIGCAAIRAECRPGWSKLLKANGYRLTHVVMEKD